MKTFAKRRVFQNIVHCATALICLSCTKGSIPSTPIPTPSGPPTLIGSPAQLILSGAATIPADSCAGYTIQTADADGGSSSAIGNGISIRFTASQGSHAVFYSDRECASATLATSIAPGAQQSLIYVKDNLAETFSMTATDAASILTSSDLTIRTTPDLAPTFGAAPGITVTQLTTSPSPGVSNRAPYYDVTAYNPALNLILYESLNSGTTLMFIRPDGTGAIPVASLIQADPNAPVKGTVQPLYFGMSPDGRFFSYIRKNGDGTEDIYGARLTGSGIYQETRVTHARFSQNGLINSPPGLDAASGRYALVFADGGSAYVVYDDGTQPTAVSPTGSLTTISLNDQCPNNPFHRLRISPYHSGILFYRRNYSIDPNTNGNDPCVVAATPQGGNGMPENYVVDWTPSSPNSRSLGGGGGHPNWVPDGDTISDAPSGVWTLFPIASNGQILSSFPPSTTFGSFGDGTNLGGILYGNYSPDGTRIVVATKPNSKNNGGMIYLMDVSRPNSPTFLCNALSSGFHGQPYSDDLPFVHFVHDANHILFSTDMGYGQSLSLPIEVYELTLP